jgi:hypothetical protein
VVGLHSSARSGDCRKEGQAWSQGDCICSRPCTGQAGVAVADGGGSVLSEGLAKQLQGWLLLAAC